MKKAFLISMIILSAGRSTLAQAPVTLSIREFTHKNSGTIVGEFAGFLNIPNVAADPVNLQKTAAFIMTMMKQRGIENIQLLTASTIGVPPAVYGEVIVPGATQTIIFYAHYDGQPVNPAQWAKGLEPF
jgi:acetylornithine deacetylase/succinyl-diaminopimelate desuccinylase-like protein